MAQTTASTIHSFITSKSTFLISLIAIMSLPASHQFQRPRIVSGPSHPVIGRSQGDVTFNWTFTLWPGKTWNESVEEVGFGIWKAPGYLRTKLMTISKHGDVSIRPNHEDKLSCKFNMSLLLVEFTLHNLSMEDVNEYGLHVEFGMTQNPLTDAVMFRLQDPSQTISTPKRKTEILLTVKSRAEKSTQTADPDCKINETHKFVHQGDLVTLSWTLDFAKISGSTGYIFGHVTYEPSARCKMKAQRVVAVPLTTKKKTCTLSGWESWCDNYTNVSLMTNTNGSKTFRITFSVESLLKYNMTTNNIIVFAIRLWRNGTSSELPIEYNVEVNILDRKRPETSTTDSATPSLNSSISLPSPTPPAKSGDKSQMSGALIAGIVIAAVAVPVAVVLLVVFYRYRQRTKCQESANGNTAKTVLDTMEPLCGPR